MPSTTHEIAPTYDPKQVEADIAARWTAAGAFHAEPDTSAPRDRRFSIVIPPPNVTAALHLGHALNNTLQDVLTRYHRMLGDNAVWLPGTDHAGIATQTVVEKRLLAQEGKKRTDYPRDDFVAKVQAWKDEYEATITRQLKDMGCSCDWDRQAFTMDETRAKAVREAFFQLFKDGLIYRGKRLVNWDPVTQTALADDEVEMQDVDGNFYYMRYPLCDANGAPQEHAGLDHVTVATTRPETMLGDTAVAVNPSDPERAKLIGQHVKLPIVGRVIPIVGDDYVVIPDPESDDAKARMASGFLKVTPAHDPNDYDIGQRHGLDIINVMAPDASISKDHGWTDWDQCDQAAIQPLVGLAREDARKAIVKWFKQHDLMGEIKPYRHAVGHSYRSHVPIEPYLSDQWYVKVTDDRLAGAALRAMAVDQRTPNTACTWTDTHPFSPAAQRREGAKAEGRGGKAEGGSANAEGSEWEGGLRFTPDRYAKTFQTWHENIRDWCISRQLWWGHRIPVWWRQMPVYEVGGAVQSQLECWIAEGRVAQSVPGGFQAGGPDEARSDVTLDAICVSPCDEEDRISEFLAENGWVQDPDVLDTWFSSALWPLSTLGWPDDTAELAVWNPTSVLCTAREIITLWVSRMVMFNVYFSGRHEGTEGPRDEGDADPSAFRDPPSAFTTRLPFHDVFIHAMIQDGHGQKMSKSLGNGVDPMDIIHSHGSDAMRFTLCSMTTHTQDVRMPVDMVDPHSGESFTPQFISTPAGHKVAAPIQERNGRKMVSSYGMASGEATPTPDMPLARNTSEKFDLGQRFANKMWNAVRFSLGNLTSPTSEITDPKSEITLPDRWILTRLARTIVQCNDALAKYAFAEYATALYDFFWRDLCDWYVEAVKPTVKDRPAQQQVLASCIDASLRLLHPVMPFITERLWESLNATWPERGVDGLELPPSELLVTAAWPIATDALIDSDAERDFELTQRVVSAIREARSANKVPPRQTVTVSAAVPPDVAQGMTAQRDLQQTLANCSFADVGPEVTKPAGSSSAITGAIALYLHDLVDTETERARLEKRRDELEKQIGNFEKRLANKSYVDKAPAKLVQETRDQLAAAQRERDAVADQLAAL